MTEKIDLNEDQINSVLREHCDWEVEAAKSPFNQSQFYRVYRLQQNVKKSRKRIFIGVVPDQISVGSLLSCASIAGHYYQLGLSHGAAGLDSRDNPAFRG
ncbi:hypothetical protein [Pseudomonas gozinkensis]|uniref:hypothetical protein n=1 Tax=Pseudomonas gozinkensis TaxID=2774461 RepID=UPI0017880B4A|nr:hypothetical protein [Pseudomonas gozinkensis]